ncbi:MAG: hypothetical protein OEL54_01680 [Flavobacteriaceae bacterium]|nr:hypothetical protein [Flavobacteriaceae bacterium]
MQSIKPKHLIANHEFICNEYILKFCNKHHLTFNYWLCEVVGNLAVFETSEIIAFTDIVHDINSKQKRHVLKDWLKLKKESFANIEPYYTYTHSITNRLNENIK